MGDKYQFPEDSPGSDFSGSDPATKRPIPYPQIVRGSRAPTEGLGHIEGTPWTTEQVQLDRSPRNAVRPGPYPREMDTREAFPRNRPVPGDVDEYQEPPRVITQKYDPRDTNRDGHVDEVEAYQAFMRQSPEERRANWVAEQLTPKGYSADYQTGEILDSQGRVVGQLPSFE